MTGEVIQHPFRDFELAGWERAAAVYTATFGTISSAFVPALLDVAAIRPGTSLLDVACGPGLVSAAAAARGAAVTGVDFSPAMVAQARQRHPALRFLTGDAEALPFEDDSFDAVLIGFGLHHFPFPDRALGEAWRVLRPGGRLAFTTWAPPEDHVMHDVVVGAVRAAGDAVAALPVAPGGAVNQVSHCAQMIAGAGFDASATRVVIVRAHIRIDSAQHLIDTLTAGTVRLSTTLRSQPPHKAAAIHAAIEQRMAPYRSGDSYQLPIAAILAVATK